MAAILEALSIDPEDPRYSEGAAAIGPWLTIYLDGVEQDRVITYDISAGIVIRYQVDSVGQLVLDDIGETVLTEQLSGTVTVELRKSLLAA